MIKVKIYQMSKLIFFRRVVELTAGSHEKSLIALVTVKASKPGLWILNHQNNGVNEILVEEGFAKLLEGEEILNRDPEPDIGKILERTRVLVEEVSGMEDEESPIKVESLMVRSKSIYLQLKTLLNFDLDEV